VSPEDDAGLPIAYEALAAGTPVHAQDGGQVGTVKQVLADEEEDVFDGLVIDTDTGSRFIDADQVAHIAEHRVDIRLTNVEVAEQPEHEEGAPAYRSEAPVGRGRDLWRRLRLRGLWRKE
jgi:sporulation protein YlmC with PRC-barrel domain